MLHIHKSPTNPPIHSSLSLPHRRLGPQQQLNVAYTIRAPAASLPSPGQFFVESAAFCDDVAPPEENAPEGTNTPPAGNNKAGAKEAKEAAALVVVSSSGGNGRRLRRQAAAKKDGDGAAAMEVWPSVDDNFLQNPLDGRWYVQSEARLNNTDAAAGRCNVQFTVRHMVYSVRAGGIACKVN